MPSNRERKSHSSPASDRCSVARAIGQTPHRRRRHIRRTFDGLVRDEWRRYAGEPRRELHRTLRERFLRAQIAGTKGITLELGPGPGRFTPIIRRQVRSRVIGLDLSRAGLLAARRRARRKPRLAPVDWVQGAGEHLPLRSGSVDTTVVFGNIVCMAARDGPRLLKELARVTKRRGRLILDFASPAAAAQEFFHAAVRRHFLPRILRRRRYYLLDQVLSTGFQPYAPHRMARWEFQFYTPAEAQRALTRAGFRTIDVMSVAPIAAFQDRVAAVARRDRRTWKALLEIEEQVGRKPGVLESGHGFVVAAVRR
jgi:ubiquinone/menaquinone biosynthesis C-methylase UbiE